MKPESSSDADALPPHPGLSRYYQGGKDGFVRQIFDQGAADYDRIEKMMALGTGSWYRHKALQRAGLKAGMKVLDVAIGTGLVAREEITITGGAANVIGVDPSAGMLAQARQSLDVGAVRGVAENLPLAQDSFDFVSMGYALRHVSDLKLAFAEYFRVLRPGGSLCILELTRPKGAVKFALLRWYMGTLIPALARLVTRGAPSRLLWRYYWDTIESCVAPEQVLAALAAAGFTDVKRYTELGIFSEYTARKPT
ncbi:MAG: class I SAM-dependent methyltransferase [Gammaproteobacteria bacterium]